MVSFFGRLVSVWLPGGGQALSARFLVNKHPKQRYIIVCERRNTEMMLLGGDKMFFLFQECMKLFIVHLSEGMHIAESANFRIVYVPFLTVQRHEKVR